MYLRGQCNLLENEVNASKKKNSEDEVELITNEMSQWLSRKCNLILSGVRNQPMGQWETVVNIHVKIIQEIINEVIKPSDPPKTSPTEFSNIQRLGKQRVTK